MSLQLFANYENTYNSSIFYRLTSNTPYNFTLRLLEDNPLVNHSYLASYTLSNNLTSTVLFDDKLTARITLSAKTPGTQVIYVTAYNDQDFTIDPIVFAMSAVFVPYFLSANYVAYPQGYLTSYYPNYRTSDQYASESIYFAELQLSGIGNAFYGEGHTESLALSTNTLYTNCSASWTVGPYNTITNSLTTSIQIPSNSNTSALYPIGLQLFNNTFVKNGPVIAYFENLSGQPSFYPFYSSSLTVSGSENPSIGTFQKSLSVLKYPESSSDGYSFISPFVSGSKINLPFDSSQKAFIATLEPPDYQSPNSLYYNPIFAQTYTGVVWNINATANPAGINPDWYLLTTKILPPTQNLRFQLSYSNEYNIDNTLLKASAGYPTSLTISASAYKNIFVPGEDTWIPRDQIIPFSTNATILPLPLTYLYVANYYNLTGTSVSFTNVWGSYSQQVSSSSTTVLYNNLSSQPLINGESDSFFFTSSDLGVIDLSAITTFVDASLSAYTKTYHAPGIFEIINSYDEVEYNHFQSEISPLIITRNSAPRLTPNEWVTSNNVNSLVDKFIQAVDELDQYTSLYSVSAAKFTGRLEQVNILDGFTTNLVLTSYTLPISSIVTYYYNIPIDTFSTEVSAISSIVAYGADPNLFVTIPAYQTDLIPNIPGFVYTWITPFLAPDAYYNWTVPSSSSDLYYTGAIVLPKSEKIMVSYQNLVNLINNVYSTRVVNSIVSVDEIFKFQKIESIQTTSKEYIVILDSVLPRVSVYTISNDQFNLFTTWGKFGYATSKSGLNNPRDLHIDQQDLIWIADTGNNCVKKFTLNGKNLLIITHDLLDVNPPLSVCVDSQQAVHVLTAGGVVVFDYNGNYLFTYNLPEEIQGVTKINTSYNRESVYITHANGVIKYFRTGVIYQHLINGITLSDGTILQGFNTVFQDKYRNVYVSVKDQIIRVADLMKLTRRRAQTANNLFWSLNELYVHKEEYIQPWVYLKTFHRLWDNIEIFRNSLFYNETNTGPYVAPTYLKSDLVIGQNEIVTNAVINRICNQLWTNLRSIISYFGTPSNN